MPRPLFQHIFINYFIGAYKWGCLGLVFSIGVIGLKTCRCTDIYILRVVVCIENEMGRFFLQEISAFEID